MLLLHGLLGGWALRMVVQRVPCMAMVPLGRLSGWATDVVLHLVSSEARACRQMLLLGAHLVAGMVLHIFLLAAENAVAVVVVMMSA